MSKIIPRAEPLLFVDWNKQRKAFLWVICEVAEKDGKEIVHILDVGKAQSFSVAESDGKRSLKEKPWEEKMNTTRRSFLVGSAATLLMAGKMRLIAPDTVRLSLLSEPARYAGLVYASEHAGPLRFVLSRLGDAPLLHFTVAPRAFLVWIPAPGDELIVTKDRPMKFDVSPPDGECAVCFTYTDIYGEAWSEKIWWPSGRRQRERLSA